MAKEELKKIDESLINDKFKTFVITGIITQAKFGRSKFDDTSKNRICIKSENIPYEEIHAYDEVGNKLTPKWFKERTGYINLTSLYDIPVKDSKGRIIEFEAWLDDYNVIGSEVNVSIIQKEGCLYPKAIKVITDGEARDPFEDL